MVQGTEAVPQKHFKNEVAFRFEQNRTEARISSSCLMYKISRAQHLT